jgi:hypothetical protein
MAFIFISNQQIFVFNILNTELKNEKNISPRFLNRTALFTGVAISPAVIPNNVLGRNGIVSPNERVNVAVIGCGLMGMGHVRRLAGDSAFEVLAVCDVDKLRRDEALDVVKGFYTQKRQQGKPINVDAYNDYREILIRDDIDAVLIATPDLWHSLMSIEAAKVGKDVYCEKPVSLTIYEGRNLADTIKRTGRVFQTGSQYRSAPVIRQVCNFVRNGGIGKVQKVFTLLDALMGFIRAERFQPYEKYIQSEKNGQYYYPIDFDLPAEQPPAGLDWDLWVGPADWHNYNKLFHVNPTPGRCAMVIL